MSHKHSYFTRSKNADARLCGNCLTKMGGKVCWYWRQLRKTGSAHIIERPLNRAIMFCCVIRLVTKFYTLSSARLPRSILKKAMYNMDEGGVGGVASLLPLYSNTCKFNGLNRLSPETSRATRTQPYVRQRSEAIIFSSKGRISCPLQKRGFESVELLRP